MTFLADGKTSFGEDAEAALSALVAAGADVVGINCTIGPQEAFEIFSRAAASVSVPVSVRPNAGYPWVVSGRTVYPATPDYFRQSARDFLTAGAASRGRLLRHHAGARRRHGARGRRAGRARLPRPRPPSSSRRAARRARGRRPSRRPP